MAQIIVQQPTALVVLLLLWLLMVWQGRARRFKPFGPFVLRLALLTLLTGAIAQPEYWPPATHAESAPERTILLVDQSAGLGAAGQAKLQAEAERLAATLDNPVTLFFAGRPLAMPPGQAADAAAFIQPEQSNLADALAMGANLLTGQTGRLILLSDGAATEGDTVSVAARLGEQGFAVDVLIDNLPAIDDVRLQKFILPPIIRQGEQGTIGIIIHSTTTTEVQLQITRTGEDGLEMVLIEKPVKLEPGTNNLAYTVEVGKPGIHTFWAEITTEEDNDLTVNNRLGAVSRVYPRPKILLVRGGQSRARSLAGALEQTGFETLRLNPEHLPGNLSALEQYDGIALLDVSARSLTLEQMLALQEFCRELGRGLLVTGGRNSFSLGNYANTPLAELIPLSLEPPPRAERPPVALLLIIDHSGSMVQNPGSSGITKLAMAKEAAIQATGILGPADLLGVLMFDKQSQWVIPFQPVSDGAELLKIERTIAAISTDTSEGSDVFPTLEAGLTAIAQQPNDIARHVVLLTDGDPNTRSKTVEEYDPLLSAARQAGITLSTIAIGSNADRQLLQYLAEQGRGRYHFAAAPEELPELAITESKILRSEVTQLGEFTPVPGQPHPMLRGLPGDGWPKLSGYIAMTPKPRAEVPLQIAAGGGSDPLLAVWGYGLGRVAAWSSDTGQEWAVNLADWPAAAQFVGQMMGYTLPAPELDLLQLQIELTANGIAIFTTDSITPAGQPLDLTPTEAILTTPDGQKIAMLLRQIEPGRYRQQVQLSAPGPYRVTVKQGTANSTAGFVLPYPAEYTPSIPGEKSPESVLREIAAVSGGEIFGPGQTRGGGSSPEQFTSSKVLQLWPWLLQAALALWPIEIAWRRWTRMRIR